MGSKIKHLTPRYRSVVDIPQTRITPEVSALDAERLKTQRLTVELKRKEQVFQQRESEYLQLIHEYESVLTTRSALAGANAEDFANGNLQRIRTMHDQVMLKISNFQHTASALLANREKSIVRKFDGKISDLMTTWESERSRLKQQKPLSHDTFPSDRKVYESLLHELEVLDAKNAQLVQRNKELMSCVNTLEAANEELVRQSLGYKRQLAEVQVTAGSGVSTERHLTKSQSTDHFPPLTPLETPRKCAESTIFHLKHVISTKSRALSQVKLALAEEISKKSQLESLIRQCVEDIQAAKGEITTKSARYELLDTILHQEKVILFLQDHLFPIAGSKKVRDSIMAE